MATEQVRYSIPTNEWRDIAAAMIGGYYDRQQKKKDETTNLLPVFAQMNMLRPGVVKGGTVVDTPLGKMTIISPQKKSEDLLNEARIKQIEEELKKDPLFYDFYKIHTQDKDVTLLYMQGEDQEALKRIYERVDADIKKARGSTGTTPPPSPSPSGGSKEIPLYDKDGQPVIDPTDNNVLTIPEDRLKDPKVLEALKKNGYYINKNVSFKASDLKNIPSSKNISPGNYVVPAAAAALFSAKGVTKGLKTAASAFKGFKSGSKIGNTVVQQALSKYGTQGLKTALPYETGFTAGEAVAPFLRQAGPVARGYFGGQLLGNLQYDIPGLKYTNPLGWLDETKMANTIAENPLLRAAVHPLLFATSPDYRQGNFTPSVQSRL